MPPLSKVALLIILLEVLDSSKGCTPINQGNQATTTLPPIPPPSSNRKRDVRVVELTVSTKKDFDPTSNQVYLHTLRAGLDSYVRANGLTLEKVLLDESVRNEGDKLVVTYAMFGVNCQQMLYALHGMSINGVVNMECNNTS
ncbi:hypothetical protein OESDEN_12547 [Oesophagostomum dentatum]|uniref:Uncharacterized protein n=1 Tax=Oesophagostomum dentatum TaxID=61180 RepID=A0A0B1SUY1_OESDE|nr:hypothetical protein OESDEN_12547 [Oesophagostomum dentatum]